MIAGKSSDPPMDSACGCVCTRRFDHLVCMFCCGRYLSVQRVYAEVTDDGADFCTHILALRFREEDVTDAFNNLSALAGQTAEFWL